MKERLVKIGNIKTGLKNNICDVDGVLVGHYTLEDGYNHTGITCIKPHSGNLFRNKVVSSVYAFNGFGKSVGLLQVEEMGFLETPILLTNTLSVPKVSDALITYMLRDNPEIGRGASTVNSLVMECNDGKINDIQNRLIEEENVLEAINNASDDFTEGAVGAGCGMICHGFKGGIGSSSRVVTINEKEYTVGVLVNSNFGESNGNSLIFKGRNLGDLIKDYNLKKEEEKGSIIVIIATDLPLNNRQLKRLCKRSELGIARTGSYAGNGSGDIMLAFSTKNSINYFDDKAIDNIERFNDAYINPVFKAVVDATEEAVLNSMLYSDGKKGFNDVYYKSLNEYKELFEDLLENKR